MDMDDNGVRKMEDALTAIRARINGEWDHEALTGWMISTSTLDDILALVGHGLGEDQ